MGKSSARAVGIALASALALSGCGAATEHDDSASDTLMLGAAANGETFSLRVGGHADITLLTVGPGRYGDPQLSSSAVRFEGIEHPAEQIPAGPTQIYHFVAERRGQTQITIVHVTRADDRFTLTLDVTN